MKLRELADATAEQIKIRAGHIYLTLPVPFERPRGWPKGKLATQKGNEAVYVYELWRIVKWLSAQGVDFDRLNDRTKNIT